MCVDHTYMKLSPFFAEDLLFIIPLLHVPCAQLPLEVLHRLGFQIRNEPPLYEWLKTSVVRQLKFLAMQGNRSGAVAK